MASPRISKLIFGRNANAIGVGQNRPLMSWRFEQDEHTSQNWKQTAYEIEYDRNGKITTHRIDSGENVDAPWPDDEPALESRESVEISIRARGAEAGWTEWYSATVEAALLHPSDWVASVISSDLVPPAKTTKRPFYLRSNFSLDSIKGAGRIYATALGVYEIKINGKRIGDHVLAPGWQSYNHRLHYQTYEVDKGILGEGGNTIEVVVGEGWYSGRLTWAEQKRNIWGSEIGARVQVEVDGIVVAATNTTWEWSYGPLISSELYDGEVYDVEQDCTGWRHTKTIPLPIQTTLVAPEAPPIRPTEVLKPVELVTTPSRRKVIDFGQNLVGWVRICNLPARSTPNECVVLRFAEVLEKGELGVRPLRSAKATDRIFLGREALADWQPTFTTHGFRYCEVTGPSSLIDNYAENFEAVVVHSAMERIGDFDCSHELVNQLHRNVVWGLRGNFVGLPTDCPQRDERLGWTGDIQAFAPTASFLYDTSGFLANWLHDLSEEQLKDSGGIVPLVVPDTLSSDWGPDAHAVWGDVCVITPFDMYQAYGCKTILEEMWTSITTWLDMGIKRGENGLWHNPRDGFQLSDWLDPRAPPDDPGAAMTDQFLVADAYLVAVVGFASSIAGILGNTSDEERYKQQHLELRKVFQHEYLAPSGRLSSDTQTAYCLGFQFNLFDDHHIKGASERLIRLARKGQFKIATGFAGTPGILEALKKAGHLQIAYRMLQEKGCPSWLYPITMGATTVWERWDSILPDGSINPGEMTSFNHYALGAVATFLHTTVAGLRPLEPGYRKILISPQPGGTITSASAYTITPYGRASVSWRLSIDDESSLTVKFEVPPNTEAVVRLGKEKDEVVGSGIHERVVDYIAEGEWPPAPYQTKFAAPPSLDTLAM